MELLRWLQDSEGPLSYVMLAAAAALEYVVPPLPGDTITLFGTVLAGTAGYSLVLVYAAMTLGSVAGSLIPWSLGLWLGHREDRWPGFLRRESTRRAIHAVCERFERHGGAYLVINRFLPALRAVFFLAAGMTELPLHRVVLFGGLSAMAWNALILAVGYSVGHNFERLQGLSETYSLWSLAAIALAALVLGIRWLIRRRAR
jgi:membrane protein DedA with SNARE-associated domain